MTHNRGITLPVKHGEVERREEGEQTGTDSVSFSVRLCWYQKVALGGRHSVVFYKIHQICKGKRTLCVCGASRPKRCD